MKSEVLINGLIEQTTQLINEAKKLKDLDLTTLTFKENQDKWNVLECLEHLNLYSDYYLPQIEAKIKNSQTKSDQDFNSGLLGDYFAKSMLPKGKLNKMKTFKSKNPIRAKLAIDVIDRFLNQQKRLVDLLNQSRNISLNQIKIGSSISKLIRLKLGDTYRFIINHQIRHFNQINRALALCGKA